MKGAYLCKMNRKIGIRGNALEINGYVSSDAPEVLFEHSEDCPCPPVPSVLFQQKGKLGQVSKLSYFFIKRRKLFLFATVFGIDYMSLIIHHLDSIGEIKNICATAVNDRFGW